ncbi:MAG: type II secretion system protein GspN [Nitrospirota bacterium]
MQIPFLKNKWASRFFFLFFGVSALLFFFYVTFPFPKLQEEMVRAFEVKTGCQADPKDQAVHFPFHFEWREMRVSCPKQAPLLLASVHAHVAILPALLRQQGEVSFQMKLSEQSGEIAGIVVVEKTPKGMAYTLKHVEETGFQINYGGISGILDFKKGSANWVEESILKGSGTLDFNIKNLQIRDQAWTGPIGPLSFQSVRGKLSWQDGVVSIGDFSADGDHATLKSSQAEMILHDPIAASLVEVTLQVFPKGQFQQVAALLIPGYSTNDPLIVGITGALALPQVLLNGRLLFSGSAS